MTEPAQQLSVSSFLVAVGDGIYVTVSATPDADPATVAAVSDVLSLLAEAEKEKGKLSDSA